MFIIPNIKHNISRYLTNIHGWRTSRKIIVIESDDWGSIRMPSKDIYIKCLKSGYPVDQNSFERYDSLLSQQDIELLFDLLAGFKDKNGNHPLITANCVVANPDFEKIKNDNFQNYHYELINETFKKYPNHGNNFYLWKQGLNHKIFYPQFHSREHLNVSLFMNALKNKDSDAVWGFQNGMPGSIPKGPEIKGNKYVEATNYFSEEDKESKLKIFLEGLVIFEKLFGYKSESIIPPNYIWSPDFDKPVFEKGVKFFQGNRKIIEPVLENSYRYHTHFLGKKNQFGQIFLVRNSLFEPSMFRLNINDPVGRCLSDMAIAFRMNKPAIISCHRINFVGYIDQKNRDNNLRLLKELFSESLKRWPDIEFISSPDLGNLILIN